MTLLAEHGVELIGDNKVQAFTDDGVEIEDRNWHHRVLKADTVVAAFGARRNAETVAELAELIPETYVVGDCDVVKNIKEANFRAYCLACRV